MEEKRFFSVYPTNSTAPEEIMGKIISELPEDVRDDVHQIFVEAISNARIHGNQCNDSKNIRMLVIFSDFHIQISIENEGDSWDYWVWEAKVDEIRLVNNLDEHGRGMVIMKVLADSVDFFNGGRKIVILKRFNPGKTNVLGHNVSTPLY